VNFTIEDE